MLLIHNQDNKLKGNFMAQNEVYLTLIRHGQSQWNLENRFTGWVDVDLTEEGQVEALSAAKKLKELNIIYNQCHASVLKRSIHTLWIIQKELELSWLPTTKAWQLNERHYGALQGLNKKETETKYGADQVKIWRRSYDTPPPLLNTVDIESNNDSLSPKSSNKDSNIQKLTELQKYKMLGLDKMPLGESLKMCQQRVLPYFTKSIAPELKSGKYLLVVAHGNSLRSLIMELEDLNGEKIMDVEIETAIPIVYKLNSKDLSVISKTILK